MTILTAVECRDKAEQKMIEAATNPALREGLIETAKAWLELAGKIEQAESLEAWNWRQRNKMAKKRRGRFTWKEGQLIQMAATSATLEEAAASFRTSVETMRKKPKCWALPGRGATAEKGRLQTKGYN
jgi:hypothetical protein